jgi:exodeoxyribonuclease VII large subunit
MPQPIRLSELISEIQETIEDRFEGESHWVTAEITDVKKMPQKQWCFLKLIEKNGGSIAACMDAVFWSNGYAEIIKFEKATKTAFENGLEITCRVRVRFNARYSLKLEVAEIDTAFMLGKIELERQQTLERLVKENPHTIRLTDGEYYTLNKSLPLPSVMQHIALITAANSDGQRDFKKELAHNRYGYAFAVTEYLTQVQGDTAAGLMLGLLQQIATIPHKFDAVAIVRGGGSQTDFKPFEDYELCRTIACFSIPVFTGIGHDSNTSIADMMARQHKTPTKVAAYIVEHNMQFEAEMEVLKERMLSSVERRLERAANHLKELKRVVKSSSPQTILNRGFAMIKQGGKIITDPALIEEDSIIQTTLRNQTLDSVVVKKTTHETGTDL